MTLFETIPVNRNVRKRLFRAARLGARPQPFIPNIGDAAKAVDVVAAYKAGWDSSAAEPARTVKAAWAERKNA